MSVKQVDVKTAHARQTDEGHTYVDVRSIPEFERGHPAGASNVPLLHHDAQTGQMRPNPDFVRVMQANFPPETKLLVGCQMGGRSAQAAQILLQAGYQDVTNVAGGFGGARDRMSGQVIQEGWADAGLPVEVEAPADNQYQHLQEQSGESS